MTPTEIIADRIAGVCTVDPADVAAAIVTRLEREGWEIRRKQPRPFTDFVIDVGAAVASLGRLKAEPDPHDPDYPDVDPVTGDEAETELEPSA